MALMGGRAHSGSRSAHNEDFTVLVPAPQKIS